MRGIFHEIMAIYFIISVFFLSGCSVNGEADKRIIAEVNRYKMTVEDLKYELKNIPFDEVELLKTEDGRKEYIHRLVEKEILLQEAQRQGLDREKDFMKSIESYWEQTLLKLLLQKKSKEISSMVHVYDNEIEEYYKASGEKQALSKVDSDIRRLIRQKKETEAMDAWVEELKEKSYIKINEDILEETLSEN